MFYIGSDHNGVALKQYLMQTFAENNLLCEDVFPNNNPEDDYPDIALLLATKLKDENNFGIAICGSGQGICMAMNRFSWVRAGIALDTETATKIKSHNHANCLCFGAWNGEKEEIWKIVQAFMQANIDSAERHNRRVEKLLKLGRSQVL